MVSEKNDGQAPATAEELSRGLFRGVLAGPGHSLAEAFANLERAPRVERVLRHHSLDLLSARVSLAPNEGKGYWELTRIRNEIFIIIQNFAYKDPRLELVPGDGLIQFNFRLSGDLTIGVKRGDALRFTRPSLLVWNQAQGVDVSEWIAPKAHERAVSISTTAEFLLENFLPSLDAIPSQLQPFIAGAGHKVNHCQLPLSANMFELASRIVNNPYTGSIALMHTNAVAIELLCSAVAGFASLSSRPNEEYSQRELRSLQAARDYLIQHLSPAPTIRQVARAMGLNETTLKRGFKAIFGETVSEFSSRCRMQHAMSLLRDDRLLIKQVADASGYRHHTSFATAFLRHFGVRPKDVRRGRQR